MCGLFAAKSKEEIIELSKRNINRGSRTHSITRFISGNVIVDRFDCKFDSDNVIDGADYYIVHVQAPTSAYSKIHPAECNKLNKRTWHNGILKSQYIENNGGGWDTMLINNMFPNLDNIDGTFACFHMKNDALYVFRNEISPLFIGENMQFSSVKTGLTKNPLEPNKVFRIEFLYDTIQYDFEFKTCENPYFLI